MESYWPPIDRGVLFFGKFLANWFFLVVIDLLILVAFVILFNLTFEIILGWDPAVAAAG